MNICLTILSIASLLFPFYDAAAVNSQRESFVGLAEKIESAQAAEKPPMFVLQIGISNYTHQRRLDGVNDVLKMRELLTGDAYKIPAQNIRTLCDGGTFKPRGGGAEIKCDGAATKAVIVKEFESHLISRAREYNKKTGGQAVVVFQFSGHGSQAPDRNGDERDDKKDETLVTWDSQDAPGKNFDISDDEIYALTKKLSPFTDNIVYILDSCNSGSGTRSSDDARSVPARVNPVVPIKAAQTSRGDAATAEKKVEADIAQTDLLPPSKNYIVISAARAGQLALQKDVFDCDTCEQSKKIGTFGILTHYLMQELRNATETTSYRDVMENVRRKVTAEKPSQTPQIEGDDDRIVFKGLSKVKQAGIKIYEAGDKRISVEAGAMQGVGVGTILDIYSIKDEKIATAKVVEAVADKAVAEIVEIKTDKGVVSPSRAVSVEAKDRAVLVSSDLGAARIKFLPDGDAAKLNDADKKIVETLRRRFVRENGKPNASGVDLATGKWNDANAPWDIALLKDRFDKVFADCAQAAPISNDSESNGNQSACENFPAKDKQVFYLADKSFVPLYGFYVEAENADAVDRIERAVAQISRLRSLKAIANDKSRLKNAIVIRPFRFKLDDSKLCASENGAINMVGKEYLNKDVLSKNYKLDLGEVFGLEIVNTSNTPLYVTVLALSTDGSVSILSPEKIGTEKEDGVTLAAKSGKRILLDDNCRDGLPPVMETAAPSGIETFKVIATTTKTTRASFEFLEESGINARGDANASPLTSLADWTTAEVEFEISSKQKNPQ